MARTSFSYFDHAAATPLDPAVQSAMEPFWQQQFYNPSATYEPARQVRQALQNARAQAAATLGAKPVEIIFTAGGTESANLAIKGVMDAYPQASLVTTAIEHDAVLAPSSRYQRTIVGVGPDGIVDVQAVVDAITDTTVLVSVMYANNEIGTIQPISHIARQIEAIRQERIKNNNDLPLLLHSDACQAANYLPLQVARLGVDLLTVNGGKMYGPRQSGLLYVRSGLQLSSLIDGGGQEQGLRSGTENVAACIGFAAALEMAQQQRHQEVRRLQDLQQKWVRDLKQKAPQAILNGSLRQRLPNNLHITLPGTDNERVLVQLEQQGILAAAGSACSARNTDASHVLTAIGLSDDDARASIRFSMGRDTQAEDVDRAVAAIVKVLL